MSVPPAFSTVSALTELLVTAAVYWFFWRALKFQDYRWGMIAVAIAYETLFNITYMVSRLFTHEEGVTHQHDPWVTWFVALHGTLSLGMFIGLVWYVVAARRAFTRGVSDPIGLRPRLAAWFLVLWTISVASGEAIYAFYWLDVIT